jgi:hypothetical protein
VGWVVSCALLSGGLCRVIVWGLKMYGFWRVLDGLLVGRCITGARWAFPSELFGL